jgi:hypothetical protein
MDGEIRFKMLGKLDPDRAKILNEKAQSGASSKFKYYELLAQMEHGNKSEKVNEE